MNTRPLSRDHRELHDRGRSCSGTQVFDRVRTLAMPSALILLLTLTTNRVCFASDDDFEPPPLQPPVVRQRFVNQVPGLQFDMVDQEFDLWFFGGNRKSVELQIQNQVRKRVLELSIKHGLNKEQEAKLNLAAGFDMDRYRREIDELRQKFDNVKDKQDGLQSLAEEKEILRKKQINLLGQASFATKALSHILTPEQLAKERAHQDQRRRTRYRSIIDRSIREIERQVALHDHQRFDQHQRDALVNLLLDQGHLPDMRGDFDDIVVKYQLSRLPEKTLKSLFEEDQWPHVFKFYNGYQEYGPILKHMGLIDDEITDAPRNNNETDTNQGPADATCPESGFNQKPNGNDNRETINR